MKNFLFVSFLVVVAQTMGCFPVSSSQESDESIVIDGFVGEQKQQFTEADKNGWKNLPQASKDAEILGRAYLDDKTYVGLNCKQWVRKVVHDSSKGVVEVPSTCPDAYGWYWCSSPYLKDKGSIYSAESGNIVQMNFNSGPHSAIVKSNDGMNICWIDSNFVANLTVGTHCQTINKFLESVTIGGTQKYTLYQVVSD